MHTEKNNQPTKQNKNYKKTDIQISKQEPFHANNRTRTKFKVNNKHHIVF